MGIFDKIKSAIWGEETESPDPASATIQKPVMTAAASTSASMKAAQAPADIAAGTEVSSKAASPGVAIAPVDVAAMLDAAVKNKGQKLDWRHSIVDLMKALNLDSSLASRKELAKELAYDGDTNNSAAMNIWLHKALMKKLAENGGRVPAELMD